MTDSPLAVSFGRVLRHHRIAQRLTQEELADESHLHPTYIGLIERGEKNPTLQVCFQISQGLNLNLAELIAEAVKVTNGGEVDK